MAASVTSPPRFCRAATKSSMKVPLVVNTAMKMNAVMRRRPPSQSHQETPRSVFCVRAAGPVLTPNRPRRLWMIPFGSLNQFGPLTPNQESTLLTAPVVLNRNSHSTVMATELVTDGK
jgi:hypothetical protein